MNKLIEKKIIYSATEPLDMDVLWLHYVNNSLTLQSFEGNGWVSVSGSSLEEVVRDVKVNNVSVVDDNGNAIIDISEKLDKLPASAGLNGNMVTLTDLGTLLDSNIKSTDLALDSDIEELRELIHPLILTTIPTNGMLPNVMYRLGTLTGSVTLSLAAPSVSTITNHYFCTFSTGATAPTITWDTSITSWCGGSAPTINANKHYEISVLDGTGIAMEV